MRRRLLSAVLTGSMAGALAASPPAHAADSGAIHKVTQSVSYVGFDPMFSTVLDEGRPVGILLVSIGLDVPDVKLRAEVNRAMPLLRDAYVRSLMTFAAIAVRPRVQPDVDLIARRLQAVTDRTLRQKGAKLLLGQIVLRMTH